MFSAAETLLPKGCTFFGQVFYGSIGFTVGATLGAAVAAKNRPVLLFVGDGSFQVVLLLQLELTHKMTCQDVSTMIRYNLTPVIFLLNNFGYLIERVIDGKELCRLFLIFSDGPYNDIQNWKYHKLP